MKDYNRIEELAERFGVTTAETTTGMNGYPQDLDLTITGFNTITELQEVYDELKVEGFDVFHIEMVKKEGQSLWNRGGCYPQVGMYARTNDSDWTVDFNPETDDAIEVAFDVILKGCELDDYEGFQKMLDNFDLFADELDSLDESCTVFFDPNQNYRVDYIVTNESTGYSRDTTTTKLGLSISFEDSLVD